MLCPLLVTATNFFEEDTAMFKGRSPSGMLLPAGDKLQPLGSKTVEVFLPGNCAKEINEMLSKKARNVFLMRVIYKNYTLQITHLCNVVSTKLHGEHCALAFNRLDLNVSPMKHHNLFTQT